MLLQHRSLSQRRLGAKREPADSSVQEARPEKKIHSEGSKKARTETGRQSTASVPAPSGGQSAVSEAVPNEPADMEMSTASTS